MTTDFAFDDLGLLKKPPMSPRGEEKITHRQDKMASLVFDKSNLVDLRSGINDLFDVFEHIADEFDTSKTTFHASPHASVMTKLEEVDNNHWSDIRAKYLEEEYYGYCKGNFTDNEMKDPAKIILDLIQKFDNVRETIHKKVDEQFSMEKEYKKEVRKIQEQLVKVEQEMRDLQWLHSQDKIQLKTMTAAKEHAENLLKEKHKTISQLQRNGTVQLWDREKSKLMEKANTKEMELERQIGKLKAENAKMRESLTKQLQTADSEFKKFKMKEEKRRTAVDGDEMDDEMDELRRSVFVLEKDILNSEQELAKQQKYFIGIVGGLRRDIKIMVERFMKENGGMIPDTLSQRDIGTIQKNLDKIYTAVSEGKLMTLRAELPEHYIGIDRDIKRPQASRRLSIAPTPTPGSEGLGSVSNYRRGSIIAANLPQFNQAQLPPIPSKVEEEKAKEDEQKKQEDEKAAESDNPVLVDSKTGQLKTITVIKHFPYMSVDYVKDQWTKFQEYDTDGNGTLDILELMHAMTTTIGEKFTAEQLKEAMSEIDIDQNNTLDFYEYLLVANMLINKSGKSDLFKSGFIQHEGKVVSKTCSIQ